MLVKLMVRDKRREVCYDNVDHTVRTDYEDRLELELFYHPPRLNKTILTLPNDGTVIYFEERGKTINTIRFNTDNTTAPSAVDGLRKEFNVL